MAPWTPICGDDFTLDSAQFPYCADPAPALAVSILLALALLCHITQYIIHGTKYAWVICMAACWEVIGFVWHTCATVDQTRFITAVPSQLVILLAPIWLNAFVYMVFGRMVYFFLPKQTLDGIRAQRVTLYFVLLDVLAFIIQACGGILMSIRGNTKLVKMGLNVYTTGIAVQQIVILLFLAVAIYFHVKMRRIEMYSYRNGWTRLILTIYVSLTCITIRVIYRLIEFQGDLNGPLHTHEYYFYLLEAGPMCFALFVWSLSHPGEILIGPDAEFLSTKERKKESKREEREKFESQWGVRIGSWGYAPLDMYDAALSHTL